MSGVIKLRTSAEIDEEAAAWVWRLDTDEVPAADRKAFEEWMRRDPRHPRAFKELGGVWNALDGLAEAKRAEKIATFAKVSESSRAASAHGRVKRALPYSMAAAAVLAAAVFFWWQQGNEAQTLSTAVGQQRATRLADGSLVHLNTNTILETRINAEVRDIYLTKGEALFTVAPDEQRPFVVHAGTSEVRALGTQFNVRLRGARDVEVTVTEGRVEVAPAVATDAGAARALSAGQRLETGSAALAAMDAQMLSKTLAWRDGAIVFDGEPLGAAIAELNRYTDIRFIVNDPQVRDLKVGGRFKAGDVEEFLLALKNALPVTVHRTADNLIYIEARPQ